MKASTQVGEFKGLPVVKQGNRKIDLSLPAMRALAIDLKVYPLTDWKKAAVSDMISETWADCFNSYGAAMLNPDLDDAGKGKFFADSLAAGGLTNKLFKLCETALDKSGGRFLTGAKMSMADYCMASLIYDYYRNPGSPLAPAIGPVLDS